MTERDSARKGAWICDPAFLGLAPIDSFHKQLSPKPRPEHPAGLKNRQMLLRKSFVLESGPESPEIDVTGDDWYKLYVNGVFVAEGPASSYHFRHRYDRISLAGFLKPGENLIAAHVYYQGLINRVWTSGDLRQGFFAELRNGGKLALASDSSWRMLVPEASSGAAFGYETQFAENIDARLWPQGWQEPGFDDSSWGFAVENSQDGHTLALSEIPPLERYELEPESVRELAPGRLLLDFGRELTGYFSCDATGRQGDLIEIRHGEELDESGSVRKMRCNCEYLDKWTLSGRAPDILELCDYKAFRYVELSLPEGVKLERPRALVRHSPFPADAHSFSSESRLLEGIWGICANAVKLCSQGAFLDCASREKGQYLGDLTVSAHSHMLLAGDARLFKKALQDFADSAFICPGLMAVSPSAFMQEIADYSHQYPLQLLLCYRHTGDRAFAEKMLPAAEGVMDYFRRHERADGLIENVRDKWNLVDWPDNLRDGYDFDLNPNGAGPGPHAALNAFYASALLAMDELRKALGKPQAGGHERLKASFIKAFYRDDRRLFADSEASSHSSLHANALALFAGLTPDGAAGELADFIVKKGFSCGVYMSYFVLKALAKAGRHEDLLRLLTNEGERSWANMLRGGATACFEAWGKDQKWNTSLCHPWASAPIPVIVEELAGIRPAKPGYAAIEIAPRLPEATPDFSLSLTLPTAKLTFAKRGRRLEIEACAGAAEVPLSLKGVKAPGGSLELLLKPGEHVKSSAELA